MIPVEARASDQKSPRDGSLYARTKTDPSTPNRQAEAAKKRGGQAVKGGEAAITR